LPKPIVQSTTTTVCARGLPLAPTDRRITCENAMPFVFRFLKSAVADRLGVTAMEYGLVAGVLATGLAVAFGALTGRLQNALNALPL